MIGVLCFMICSIYSTVVSVFDAFDLLAVFCVCCNVSWVGVGIGVAGSDERSWGTTGGRCKQGERKDRGRQGFAVAHQHAGLLYRLRAYLRQRLATCIAQQILPVSTALPVHVFVFRGVEF